MTKFALKHKNGEVVNTISANSKHEATLMFSTLKKITPEQLLEIFEVEKFVR